MVLFLCGLRSFDPVGVFVAGSAVEFQALETPSSRRLKLCVPSV